MTRALMLTAALLLVYAPTAPGSPATGPKALLTGCLVTKHFDVHYRPGSRAGASAAREGALAEQDLADICKKLDCAPEGRFDLYLYDDVAELQWITGTSGDAGFSSGTSTHVVHDQDQTIYHELVHVVAGQWPSTGPANHGMFLKEGLANALLHFVSDVDVDDVAKFYEQRGELPKLETFLNGDFYAWLRAHPGFDAYDIGGSYVRFLLHTYGVKKTRLYYTGTPAKQAFGRGVPTLEKEWKSHLESVSISPEVMTLLEQRNGGQAEFKAPLGSVDSRIPKSILGKPSDWTSLMTAKLVPQDGTSWKREKAGISGSGTGGWHVVDLGTKKYADCAVRAVIETKGIFGGVDIQLGDGAQAMLVGNGTFVYCRGRSRGMSPARHAPASGKVRLMLVRRGNRLAVWVNGVKLAEGRVDAAPEPVGIGFHAGPANHTGSATFTDVRVRKL